MPRQAVADEPLRVRADSHAPIDGPAAPRETPGDAAKQPPRESPSRTHPIARLQDVATDAAQRLRSDTHADRVLVWLWEPGTGFRVCAFAGDGDATAPERSDATARAVDFDSTHAIDFGASNASDSATALCRQHRVSAGMWVGAPDQPLRLLLLWGRKEEAPGHVRPRTLARLQRCAAQLEAPLSAATAARALFRLEEETLRRDRLATLGDLLSELAHEIRNPLVAIKTFLQLLPSRLDDPDFHGDFREVVFEELRRLERLVDTVVRHARPSPATDGEGADPAEVFATVSSLLAQRSRETGVRLETEFEEGLPRVAIHPDALRQVLLNLALNALEVTPEGERVVLRAEARPAAQESAPAVGWALLEVDDTGPGVPPELRTRIFEAFFSDRTDRPGGLGLAISQRIVREAGGDIHVVDAPGGGARFRIALPLASGSASAEPV